MTNCDNTIRLFVLLTLGFQIVILKNLKDKKMFEVKYIVLFVRRCLSNWTAKKVEMELISKLKVDVSSSSTHRYHYRTDPYPQVARNAAKSVPDF